MEINTAKHLVRFIQEELNGAFRSAALVDKAAELGVSKRTTDTFIKKLWTEGLITKFKAGLYLTTEAAELDADLALARLGMVYAPNGVVSLDSAFNSTPLREQARKAVSIVTPHARVSTLHSDSGSMVEVFSSSDRLQKDIRSAIGSIEYLDEGVRRHIPEAAIILSCYLSKACGLKSTYRPEATITDMGKGLSMEKLGKASKAIGLKEEMLEDTLQELLDNGQEYDYSPNM